MAKGTVNKVILIGKLGKDPEIRYTPNGLAIANLSLATTESYKDKNTGQNVDTTEWHRITFFNKPAEIIGQYCKKGSGLYIEGRLQTRKWQDNNGQDRYSTDILGSEFQFMGSSNQQNNNNQNTFENKKPMPQNKPQAKPPAFDDSFEDDIPF